MFMRHKESLPDNSIIFDVYETRRTYPTCMSILFDVYETHRTSIPCNFHLNWCSWDKEYLYSIFSILFNVTWCMFLCKPAFASEPIWRGCESTQDLWIRTDRKLRAVQKKLKLSLARVHSALQSHSVGTFKELSTTPGSSWAGPPYAI